MPVFTEYDKLFPRISPSVDLGEHRLSCFEKMGEAFATLLVGLALVLIAGGLFAYGATNSQLEMFALAGLLFGTIFSVVLLLGVVNTIKSKKQVHLFELGLVQTDHKGVEIVALKYCDIETCKIKHQVVKMDDRYVYRIEGAGHTIKFTDHAKRFHPDRNNKLHSFANLLKSKLPQGSIA